MNYGSISFESLYKTIIRNDGRLGTPPDIPRRGTLEFREYSAAWMELIKNVPGDKAVYVWYSKDAKGRVEHIYVGESHKNKNGLRGRFTDEFKQWYHIFWMKAFNSKKYEKDVINMYNTPTKDYTKEVTNQTLKHGATHSVYCSHNSDHFHPLTVQNDLIQLFGNPRGNAKDIRKIPLPEHQLHQISTLIFNEFKILIEKTQSYTI